MKKSIFTIPKVVKYDDLNKSWYIYFRFNNELFRFKFGINKIKNYNERLRECETICKAIHQKLKDGWDPTIPDLYKYDSDLKIIKAIQMAFDSKKENISDNTITAYNTTVKYFCKSVKKLKLDNLNITDMNKIHIKAILKHAKETNNWSGKSYNKNLGYLKAILSELVEMDILPINPALGIKSLKVPRTADTITASDSESEKIKEKLLCDFPNFYVFVVTIFHTGIRPEELLSITVQMLDLEKKQIKIPAEITKTNIDRIVPINQYLEKEFLKMDLSNKENFVFGSNRKHLNRGLKKDLDFMPGPIRLNRDCASKLWRKLIKNDLGINSVNMYSMKHLGADKKILAGIELDALRELYGHTNKKMTEVYAKKLKEVNRNQILEKSPDF
jgi:site-specific recombinase XerD